MSGWNPEVELNRDPHSRPSADDMAGWTRFYAGAFYASPLDFDCAPWGVGRWRYDDGCESCHAQEVADRLEQQEAEIAALRLIANGPADQQPAERNWSDTLERFSE